MRKLYVMIIAVIISANLALAGGIITNSNQSASFIRMLARDASLNIDAVYYNPAGLTSLTEGWHISLNNQYIMQTRTIHNNLASLNKNEFEGTVDVPVFPNIYAAYKMGKLAFSFGFNPAGGGGKAVYEDGIPSLESTVSRLVPTLSRFGVNDYRNDMFFEGSSVYLGGQLGVSYELFEGISIFGGARYVMAKNRYEGYLRNIQVNTPEGWMRPGVYLRDFIAPTLSGVQRSIILGTADALNAATADADVDVVQKGSAITPVVGLSYKSGDKWNIGIKYEFITELELENETETDGTGMFPDGASFRSDMPALLSAGASYQATPKLVVSGGVHYYFDKAADYGRTLNGDALDNEDVIDTDFMEFAVGAEYTLTNYLLVSAGYLRTQTGVNDNYQRDISHSLSTNNLGAGTKIRVNEMIAVNLGFMMTFYDEGKRNFVFDSVPVRETYNRDNMVVAIGVDLSF